MEQVKEAFSKVKQDIDFLKNELDFLREGLKETRQSLIELCELVKKLSIRKENPPASNPPTGTPADTPTHPPINLTTPADTPTHPTHYRPLKEENLTISTGNEGVPTNKQTNQQTNQHTDKSSYNTKKGEGKTSLVDAVKILDSLDNLRKDVRLKFKRLTDQEMVVFSALYQAEEEEGYADYRALAQKLKLTESSIRDYVGRLIKKGIPVEKIKVNNKNIQLIISPNLKKIASLSTILQLRGL